MKIDFHTHVFSPEVIENRKKYFRDPAFSMLYGSEKSKIADHISVIRSMDQCGIDFSVAMEFPWKDEKDGIQQNEYFSCLKEYTNGRIIPFGSLDLNDAASYDDQVGYIKETGLAGIGEVAFYNTGFGKSNAGILERLLDSAGRYEMPVCIHATEAAGKDYAGRHETDLSVMFDVLKNFSNTVIILAHWGGGLIFYELTKKTEDYFHNIYYDTAASLYLYRDDIFRIGVDIAGSEKILFGSDYPLINFSRYFDPIDSMVCEVSDRENIYYRNAVRILKGQNIAETE